MKILFNALILTLLIGCSKNNDSSISDQINNTKWLVTEYKSNGVSDPSVVAQNHTYDFRSDGKVYFSQTGPVYKDTLQFEILNSTSIKISKPSASPTAYISLKIDYISETNFDFTLTSNENADIDNYKSIRQ